MSTVPFPRRSGDGEVSSADLLDEVVFTLDDFVEAGRIAWLELHLGIAADVDRAELPRMIAELIRSTSQREIELGGMGLVLDREASEVAATGLLLVLRPLDVRRSEERLDQLAEEIQEVAGEERHLNEPLVGLLDQIQSHIQSVTMWHPRANPERAHGITRLTVRVQIEQSSKRRQML